MVTLSLVPSTTSGIRLKISNIKQIGLDWIEFCLVNFSFSLK